MKVLILTKFRVTKAKSNRALNRCMNVMLWVTKQRVVSFQCVMFMLRVLIIF
jgi:hypothetical protein